MKKMIYAVLVAAMLSMLAVSTSYAVSSTVPSPPAGGTGAVTVTSPLYSPSGEHIGYISVIYIFENGFLKGVTVERIYLPGHSKPSNEQN